MELHCECGRSDCANVIHVTTAAFESARAEDRNVLCARSREHFELERVDPTSDSQENDYVIAVEPEWGAPIDVGAVEAELAAVQSDNDVRRAALDSTLTRVAAAASTGALITGLLAVFAPDKPTTLSVWWVAPGLVIVAGLIWSSLVRPAGIRDTRRRLLDPGRYMTLRDFEEVARTRYALNAGEANPAHGIFAVGATYAMLDRREAAKAVAPNGWERLLPMQDALVWELYRQDQARSVTKMLQDRADRAERNALAWMFVLLAYAVVIALFA